MKILSQSLEKDSPIAPEFAFGRQDAATHVALSNNRNPHIAWQELPDGTRSLALICNDPDVPSVGDDVNKEGVFVPASLPRVDFYHWVLIDIEPSLGSLAEGAFSHSVTARGKSGPQAPLATRHGINNYTDWFAGDADMAGDYYGYDGPCPPWNDELLHHYVFTLYALDVDRLDIAGVISGPSVLSAMQGHILGQASLTTTYTLNPSLG